MKKLFLISALALCTFASRAVEVKLLWLNEGVKDSSGQIRQGVGHNGKMYLLNSQFNLGSQGWIEVWGPDGLEEKIQPEGGVLSGTNITTDDAGNIIARAGVFPNAFKGEGNTGVFVYNAETGEKHLFNLNDSKIMDGRNDFWGHVSGDVTSEDGGLLLFGTANQSMFNEVKIVNCEHVLGGQQGIKNNYWFPTMSASFGTTGIMSNYSWLPGEAAFMVGPGAGSTVNPIYHMWYDTTGETWVWRKDGEYYTPERNITSGFALFTISNETYIIYSRGGNNADAFAIAKARVKKDEPAADEEAIDEASLIVYRAWAMMNADETNTLYNGTANTGVHFNVEVDPETNIAYIYQYCPRNFVAVYEFKPDGWTGIESVAAKSEAPVEYYNIQGVKVQNPGHGIYIMRQGDKVTKIAR